MMAVSHLSGREDDGTMFQWLYTEKGLFAYSLPGHLLHLTPLEWDALDATSFPFGTVHMPGSHEALGEVMPLSFLGVNLLRVEFYSTFNALSTLDTAS